MPTAKGQPKVAHIATVDLTLRFLLLEQLDYLSRAGYEVVGISAPGPYVSVLEHAGLRHIPVTITRHPFSPLADLRSVIQLVRILRRERCTIVHTHNPKPGFWGQIAARLAGVPVVVNTVHGFYFHEHQHMVTRRFYLTLERIAARFSDAIFFQSREDLATALRARICPPGKAQELGNGIDIRRFDPAVVSAEHVQAARAELRLPDRCPVVGFVGRLVREKGVLDLLAAARLIRQQVPDVRFVLVGPVDTPKRDFVTPEAAAPYGVADICHFAGMREDLPVLYPLMDVLVLPSRREGMPRALMEASAMGVPCVATDVRGCREVVEHGVNGLLVPLHDVPALADAVVRLLRDRPLAQRMGAAGRRLARERFDERVVFGKVQSEYARLLDGRGLPVPQAAQVAAGVES